MGPGGTDETVVGLLITQRSQVQVLSPLQRSAGQRLESIDSSLFRVVVSLLGSLGRRLVHVDFPHRPKHRADIGRCVA